MYILCIQVVFQNAHPQARATRKKFAKGCRANICVRKRAAKSFKSSVKSTNICPCHVKVTRFCNVITKNADSFTFCEVSTIPCACHVSLNPGKSNVRFPLRLPRKMHIAPSTASRQHLQKKALWKFLARLPSHGLSVKDFEFQPPERTLTEAFSL